MSAVGLLPADDFLAGAAAVAAASPGDFPPEDVVADQAWPPVGVPIADWEARGSAQAQGASVAAALATSLDVSGLPLGGALDPLLRAAVEFARGSIGLERVAFYLREPCAGRVLLRGTWGTGSHGETTDEHALSHDLSLRDGSTLLELRATGACALYRPRARWFAQEAGEVELLGEGWVMVTPLVSGNDLVGVMYNDAALSRSAVDPGKQAAAAVLASVVGMDYAARCHLVRWEPLRSQSEPTGLAERARRAVDQDLTTRGQELARRLGVSAGHLARVFKREMGVSLVDYRNRKRIALFAEAMAQSGPRSSKQAAFAAGFGSYAQFHRVRRKLASEGFWRQGKAGAQAQVRAPHAPAPWPPAPR